MDNHMQEIGQRIRALRDERGMTQGELAKALGMGDESVVSKIENGVRGLAAAELAEVCVFFGVRSDTLVFGTSEEPVGALLRSEDDADARRVVERVEEAFADLRYVRALIES